MMPVEAYAAEARTALSDLYGRLNRSGCAAPAEVTGQLIRPVLALAGAAAAGHVPDERVWAALAAVQLAHEASLVHDDVIDAAAQRRSRPTLAASKGVAMALVEGDHLLTTAYRVAASTGSPGFMSAFTFAVERTVAGEKRQGRLAGQVLDERTYREVVGSKSGELLGCALAASALVRDAPEASELYVVGRRIGTLYQMLDDLLDYCPATDTGKPALGDFSQRRWTWPLLELPGTTFDTPVDQVLAELARPGAGGLSPLDRCLRRFEWEADMVRAALAVRLPGDRALPSLVTAWCMAAAAAVELATANAREARLHATLARRLPQAHALDGHFAVSSRTFSFAARLFPAEFRQRIARLYAFCRATDDLADGEDAGSPEDRLQLLAAWERLARSAHAGTPTGIPLLNAVMADAAAAGVPFAYVEELVEGMRMDVRGATFDTLAELDVYCYRVAGVIGQWMTRMCGISDAGVLERAACLGRAMQLTNIVRDVGEDLQYGRLYIPGDVLSRCGLRPADLRAAAATGRLPRRYDELLETMMQQADADYVHALDATPRLPAWFRRAVVVAAHTYRGIHDGVRHNGYDNLRRRAYTTGVTKLRIAVRALATYDRRSPAAGLRVAAAEVTFAARPDTPPLEAGAHAAQHAHAVHAPRAARPLPGGRGRALRGVAGAGMIAGLAFVPLHTAPGTAQAGPGRGPAIEVPAVPPVGAHVSAHVAAYEARFAAAPHDRHAILDLVRVLFLAGVDDTGAVRRGTEVLGRLEERVATAEPRPLLLAYEGGFAMLEAKHGTWPWTRLRAVRAGLARLDVAVASAPDNLEVRYLRLVNTLYLPGVFGRGDSARDDLHAVRRLLPHAGPDLPPLLVRVMAEVAADAP